ncbi:MAG: DUF3093 domain-containing protein [Actinomycetales bacterium]|nr:DUF3093 domain-containing protein [Actinomycetales bacterium]
MEIQQSNSLNYRERVLPSVWSLWPVLLILPTTWLTLLPFNARIGEFTGLLLGLLFSIGVLVSIWFASPVIEVDERGFAVGDSLLPLDVITGYEVIPANRAFEERGHLLDPSAYVRFQLSVNTLIKLQITDANDSTPYWLIATRNPQAIADSLVALNQQ